MHLTLFCVCVSWPGYLHLPPGEPTATSRNWLADTSLIHIYQVGSVANNNRRDLIKHSLLHRRLQINFDPIKMTLVLDNFAPDTSNKGFQGLRVEMQISWLFMATPYVTDLIFIIHQFTAYGLAMNYRGAQ